MKKLILTIIIDDDNICSSEMESTGMYPPEIIGHLEAMKFTVLLKEQKKSKKPKK